MPELTPQAERPSENSSSSMPTTNPPPSPPERGGAIGALRFFAWLDLIAGAIGAIVVWSNFGSIEVPIYGGSSVTRTHANPFGIGLGIALFAQGIFLSAFFLVIAGAAEDIAAIRKKGAS